MLGCFPISVFVAVSLQIAISGNNNDVVTLLGRRYILFYSTIFPSTSAPLLWVTTATWLVGKRMENVGLLDRIKVILT